MDPTLLVSHRFNAGSSLLVQIVKDGFEIKAAFWVETTRENLLQLYVVTPLVDQLGLAKAYTKMHASLYSLTGPRFILDELQLIGVNDPIAQDVLRIADRSGDYSGRNIYKGNIGDLFIEWGYIYPETLYRSQPEAATVPEGLVRDLLNLIGRGPGPFPPSHVALRDGRSFDGVPVEFTMAAAQPSMVKFAVTDQAGLREVMAREIVAIN